MEPAHKKFKSLFDESDPDRIAQSGMEEYKTMFSQKPQSYTQSEMEPMPGPSRLNAVPEEDEESGVSAPAISQTQSSQLNGARGQKRKVGDEDVDMDDEENPRHKARTTGPSEPVVAVEKNGGAEKEKTKTKTTDAASTEKPKSKTLGKTRATVTKAEKSTGASGGKEDKDEAFLKAVASTKRGKKKEDDYDREFNNLRISKPDLNNPQRDEWAVLEEFGDDGDLRGNFMVVVEMDVFKKEPRTNQGVYRRAEGRQDWVGKPDFKKFKKVSHDPTRSRPPAYMDSHDVQKSSAERRPPVELVVEETPEFNFGTSAYNNSFEPSSVLISTTMFIKEVA